MIIRDFQIGDYETVFSIWKEAGLVLRPGDDIEGIRLKLERDPDLFLVMEENGQAVATVMGAWDGRRGWIYHITVKPSHQRKGIGTALVRELEKRFARKGVKKINAQIYQSNTGSLEFFKAIGYNVHSDLIMADKIAK